MSYEKITFVDRIAEYPTRRKLTTIDTQQPFGTYDVSRDEGTVSQEGTALNAATFNALQANVESAFVEVDDNIASAYDETSTYAQGDFCIYEGVLYQANQDIETAEEWDSTHWDSVKLTDIMGTGSASIDDTVVASDKTWSSEHIAAFLPEDSASGAIASFPDGANAIPCPSVLCTINPVQDLHGQDYPYPSGGGKNKLPMTVANLKAVNTSGTWNGNVYTNGTVTYTIQTDNGNNVTGIVVNGTPSGTNIFSLGSYTIESGTYTLSGCASGGSTTSYYVDVRNDGGGQVIDSGNGASFTSSGQSGKTGRIVVTRDTAMSNKLFTPMLRLSSASSSYAPYSNICPITGHTELNLVHTGKNLLDKSQLILGKFYNFINGVIIEQNNANKAHSPLLKVKPSATYYMSGFAGNSYYSILALDSEKKPINYYGGASKTEPFIATLPNNCEFVYLNINAELVDTTMFCESDAIIPYEPYTGSTTTTDLGTTVYGGTLDVETGVLTIDRGMVKISDINWTGATSNPPIFRGLLSSIPNIQLPPNNSVPTTAITESFGAYAYSPASSSTIGKFAISDAGSNRIVFIDDSVNTLEAFLQKYGDDILVYPLATPTTTQLTPTEVKSLLGSNNFYHDCNGEVAVTYKADIGLYIAKKTA